MGPSDTFAVAMSSSAMPSALSAATIFVICSAAAWRAALALSRSTFTPRLTVAMSGTTVTLPWPATAIVCSGGVSSAARATPGWCVPFRSGPATRPTRRAPVAMTRAVRHVAVPAVPRELIVPLPLAGGPPCACRLVGAETPDRSRRLHPGAPRPRGRHPGGGRRLARGSQSFEQCATIPLGSHHPRPHLRGRGPEDGAHVASLVGD